MWVCGDCIQNWMSMELHVREKDLWMPQEPTSYWIDCAIPTVTSRLCDMTPPKQLCVLNEIALELRKLVQIHQFARFTPRVHEIVTRPLHRARAYVCRHNYGEEAIAFDQF